MALILIMTWAEDIPCSPPLMSSEVTERGFPAPETPPSPCYSPELIRRLVNSDDLKIFLAERNPPLHIAATAQNPVAVRILLDFVVNTASLDEVGLEILLFRASKFNDWIGASSRAYREPESQLNDRIAAALRDYSETLSLLLEQLRGCRVKGDTASTVAMSGFDKLKRFNGDAIMRYVLDDNLRNDKLIREHGVDANQLNPYGQNLVHIAAKDATSEGKMIRVLCQLGVDINATDSRGNPPLSLFCKFMLKIKELPSMLGDRERYVKDLLSALVMCGLEPEHPQQRGRYSA
ncbi:hypothetical protein LX32DRAFT_716189 [Colletotrichum zoysiae]|uniref:Ankyrin repeat protein n=1 Tax=Colletotrichum zoysiae TaxID=1216348 RepID=A0AAD9M1P5_9PEZI|nr:hypothetical protein LX32DRAFT_716189 [Colletotrichum zoysiae]